MRMSLYEFASCLNVNEELIEEALAPTTDLTAPSPKQRIFALIERMLEVATPRAGAPRLLLVMAKLACCSWLDGILEVRLRADRGSTTLEILVDDGYAAERLQPIKRVGVPLDEFTRTAQARAAALMPLQIVEVTEDLLVMRADQAPDEVGLLEEQMMQEVSGQLLQSASEPPPLLSAQERATLSEPPPSLLPLVHGPSLGALPQVQISTRSDINATVRMPAPRQPEGDESAMTVRKPPTEQTLAALGRPALPPPGPAAAEAPAAPNDGTTVKMSANQAAEMVAKIRLKKRAVSGGISEEHASPKDPRKDE